MSTPTRVRVGAILLTILAISVSACTNAADGAAQPETRHACEVALPPAWQQAFANSGVATGGSTTSQAVGPAGEVVAVRDNGPTSDLILLGPDKSITRIYTVPNPDGNDVEFMNIGHVTIDDRWIVVGVSSSLADRRPYIKDGRAWADNGRAVGLKLNRIDVIDRQDNSVRTIARTTEAKRRSGDEVLNSIALFADTVYWIADDNNYSSDGGGILRSYDLNTEAEAEVASGAIHELRATPVGITWFEGLEYVVRDLAPLPAALAAVPGIDEDQPTLVGDGTNFAWLTGLAKGGTGIAWWSPDTGVAYLTTRPLYEMGRLPSYPPPIYLEWPYVVISQRVDHYGTSAIVDTRSRAIADLTMSVAGADGGTIATQSSAPGKAPFIPAIAGLVRTDALHPLSC